MPIHPTPAVQCTARTLPSTSRSTSYSYAASYQQCTTRTLPYPYAASYLQCTARTLPSTSRSTSCSINVSAARKSSGAAHSMMGSCRSSSPCRCSAEA